MLYVFPYFRTWASDIPEYPRNICVTNQCTHVMQEIFQNFTLNPNPIFRMPAMYSGECYHKSPYLDEDQKRFIGLLAQEKFFAPVFQYTGDKNEMEFWDVDFATKELSTEWKEKGQYTERNTSTIVEIPDDQGEIGYVHWMRQNRKSGEVYLISYQANWTVAFCKLRINKFFK